MPRRAGRQRNASVTFYGVKYALMKILRVFNNNVVLARDGRREVIVTGRGVGFKAQQGQDVDASRVAKVFVAEDGRDPDHSAEMLANVPGFYIRLVIDAMRAAELPEDSANKLTLVVAIADHISMAVRRQAEGISIAYPLMAEVRHLYAQDYRIARRLLKAINAGLKEPLAEEESVALTLHLVNAGFTSGDLSYTYQMTGLIQQMLDVIGQHYGCELSSEDVSVARFITHLRYLFVRIQKHKQLSEEHSAVGDAILHAYPEAAVCAQRLSSIIELRLDEPLTKDEEAYLTMHVARLAPR